MDFINKIGVKNIIMIVAGIVIFIIVLLLLRSTYLKKMKKKIVDIENRMHGIKSMPIQYRLGRAKNISTSIPGAEKKYEQYVQEYKELSDYQKKELAVLVNEVDEQLFYGKLGKVSRKMKQLDEMLEEYEERSQVLLNKIEKITEVENQQRVEIIGVKEKYRHTIDQFETVRFKIEDFVPRLLEKFNTLDDSFVQLEELMNTQKYEESKLLTKKIQEEIQWIDTHLENLPGYVAVVRNYVPKKLHTIHELIDSMPSEDFSLNQLDVTNRLNVIQTSLDQASVHIKDLKLDGMTEVLQALVDAIDALINDLQNEKNSFEEFRNEWDSCYELIINISEQYKQVMEDYDKITSLYVMDGLEVVISQNYKEFDDVLKASYDLEDEVKNGDFSYLQMIYKVKELKEKVNVHNEHLTNFCKLRDNLYLQEKRAIDELENINIVLLEIKSEIKNRHLPMINESYKDYIQDSYDKAAQIQAYRQTRPIELKELARRVDEARDVIYKLYDNVHNLIVTAQMVEEAIIFGNRYRSSFLEVNTELTKAEVLFRNGEYTKALSTTVDIIEKIQPGSYEELIKKSNEKSA